MELPNLSSENKNESIKILWHRIFGATIEKLLTPTGILVSIDYPIMSNPPKADVILIRKNAVSWTAEQLKYLPDGIRHSKSSHILIEYKKSESINKRVLSKTLAYDTFYKETQNLKQDDVQTFLISSKSINKKLLEEFGYKKVFEGVYNSKNHFVECVSIIELNNLVDTLHNDSFKCFASKIKEREKAVKDISINFDDFSKDFQTFFGSFVSLLASGNKILSGGFGMVVIDEKNLVEYVAKKLLEELPIEERLAGISAEKRLAGISADDILTQTPAIEKLEGILTEDVLKAMTPQKRKELKDFFTKNDFLT